MEGKSIKRQRTEKISSLVTSTYRRTLIWVKSALRDYIGIGESKANLMNVFGIFCFQWKIFASLKIGKETREFLLKVTPYENFLWKTFTDCTLNCHSKVAFKTPSKGSLFNEMMSFESKVPNLSHQLPPKEIKKWRKVFRLPQSKQVLFYFVFWVKSFHSLWNMGNDFFKLLV